MENHIKLEIPQCVQGKANLLVDTESDINMIKPSCLRDEIWVDETKYYRLKGINHLLVNTIGQVILEVRTGQEDVQTPFQVVKDDFPLPHDGLLGSTFIEGNGLDLDYYSRKVTYSTAKPLLIAPRM